VQLAQDNHAFLFGCTAFEFVPVAAGEPAPGAPEQVERLTELWFDVFNAATLPFYWAASSRCAGARTPHGCSPPLAGWRTAVASSRATRWRGTP
jgi:hypothetical protein